ncbi:FtsQ-type POTRA domain-containing protein [Lyngbya sp. CCAP 1446/10]|uniref:cell division protein FtsQ/DivIB n=1 Tax=Lyngbya sp. CCAP 1446/10 TaxID=439293 RepID=UPI0022371521|nr:FtsQ-type POTRA domain-containing protein [Lyngbya sp. CCAP 1446/10]MCW6053048.1 FtsQ-type POTRA domain-containing protein [Lyngbya sp. CCAP 1446/10]
MASFGAVSQTELGRRREELRRQRRARSAAVLWQTVAASALAGGLLWWIAQPAWLIVRSEQVKVEGNQWLSDKAVRSLVPLSYPQSLWGIQPQALAEKLESTGPIAKAKVTRNLFPPSLTIEVAERLPVAVAQPTAVLKSSDKEKVGWLDARGGWMPSESYTAVRSQNSSIGQSSTQGTQPQHSLPTLKVIGPLEQYRTSWPKFYQGLSGLTVKVFEIDWQDPNNLILKTEIGTVHLGPYSSKTASQLQVLDRMRQLPKQLDSSLISYIDLKNPAAPIVHLPEPPPSLESSTPAPTPAPN